MDCAVPFIVVLLFIPLLPPILHFTVVNLLLASHTTPPNQPTTHIYIHTFSETCLQSIFNNNTNTFHSNHTQHLCSPSILSDAQCISL